VKQADIRVEAHREKVAPTAGYTGVAGSAERMEAMEARAEGQEVEASREVQGQFGARPKA